MRVTVLGLPGGEDQLRRVGPNQGVSCPWALPHTSGRVGSRLYAYNVLDEVTGLTHVPSPDEQLPLSDNAPPTRTTAIRHDFERDAIGRLLSKRTEDGTTDYGYDAADNLLSITFTDNKGEQQQLDYTYDANGQLLSETNSAGLLQYRYDELGNLQTLVLPDQRELNHLYYDSGHLQPLLNLMRESLLSSRIIHCDETRVQVLKES